MASAKIHAEVPNECRHHKQALKQGRCREWIGQCGEQGEEKRREVDKYCQLILILHDEKDDRCGIRHNKSEMLSRRSYHLVCAV